MTNTNPFIVGTKLYDGSCQAAAAYSQSRVTFVRWLLHQINDFPLICFLVL